MMQEDGRWRVRFTWMVLLVTTLPYLLGYFLQGSDHYFSGFVFGVEDGNSYLAKMMSGTAGAWLFRTSYTAAPQTGAMAYLPYLLLGKLAAAPNIHDQLIVLFQIFRVAGVILLIKAVYAFLSLMLPHDDRLKKYGVWIAVLGGGLGFLFILGGSTLWDGRIPLEFYSPETFGFLMVYGLPHLAFARAFLLWGFVYFLDARQPAYKAGLCWLLVGFFQPLSSALSWMVMAGFLLAIWVYVRISAKTKPSTIQFGVWFRRTFWAGLVSSPMVLYNLFMFLGDPFLRAWSQQNIIDSPPVGDYLLAYGLALLVLALGVRKIKVANRPEVLLLITWAVMLLPLAYFPHNLQRRLPEAGWVILTALALLGLSELSPGRKRLGMVTLGAGLLTTIFFFTSTLFGLLLVQAPLYTSYADAAVYRVIAAQADANAVVLAPYSNSNEVPAWAPVRVVLGHGPESIEADVLKEKIKAIYSHTMNEADWRAFVEQYQVDFIVWPAAAGDMPYAGKWLYSNSDLTLFRVTN